MGKVGKWMRNFLTGKKDKEKQSKNTSSPEISASSGNEHCLTTPTIIPQPTIPKDKIHPTVHHVANVSKKDEFTVVAATAAAVAAAKAAAAMIQLTSVASGGASEVEEAAAIKIQSAFRAYLARKALNALKGLVKLQAMVRGQLVRKQATITLKYMQALVAVQARARSRRFQMAEETKSIAQRQFIPGKSTTENKFRNLNQDFEEGLEGNTKIVEMDLGDDKPVTRVRNSYSNQTQFDGTENRISTNNASIKKEHQQISQATSPITNTSRRSRRTCSKHFEEYSFSTALSSPQCYSATSLPDPTRLPFSYPRSEYTESPYNEYPSYPNYMANTESSRAKLCSHSAPKHRPAETFERQQSRRRPSPEGRNVSKAVRIQRSSSNVGSTAHNYQYPWFFKLDRSTASFKGSDCGSTSTALANTNYC